MPEILSPEELRTLDAWWRAANYLTIGQIYLQENPLLREPLQREHIKPRLLGHWGTSPGLSLIYAHLNRLIRRERLEAIYLAGPGHGGPAIVACTYLEGTYSEVYPRVTRDVSGLRRLFRQFSPRGNSQPRQRAHPGVDPRRWRARLRAEPRLRRSVRRPLAAVGGGGRRRGGGDGVAGRELEGHQLPQPCPRRSGAPHPPSQRLQDCRPHRAGALHRRAGALAARGPRVRGAVRGGRRPGPGPPGAGRGPRRMSAAHPGHPAVGPRRLGSRSSALAGAGPPHAQGLDRSEGGRREAGGGNVPLPSSSAGRGARQPGAPPDAGGVAEELSPGGALRRQGDAGHR